MFFFSSRRRHTRSKRDWSSDVCSSDLKGSIALANSGTQISLVGDDLPSASLPMREVLGLPMSGKVRFVFDLDLPNEKTKRSEERRVGKGWGWGWWEG